MGEKKKKKKKKKGGPPSGPDIWLKKQCPKTPAGGGWGDKVAESTFYAWDAKAAAWEPTPVASSDRVVWGGGKLWQHNLTLSAARGSERATRWQERGASLAAGKYLVKVYVDSAGRVAEQGAAAMLASGAGEVESTWPTGYGRMTVLDSRRVK